jgi:hypothetical protein
MKQLATFPTTGQAAPGLPAAGDKARLLHDWAYQSGHLHALQLLDTVLTFHDRQASAANLGVQADLAVVQGFLDTLRPALLDALMHTGSADAQLAQLGHDLLQHAAALMEYRPLKKGKA